jgi:hypothetical protein
MPRYIQWINHFSHGCCKPVGSCSRWLRQGCGMGAEDAHGTDRANTKEQLMQPLNAAAAESTVPTGHGASALQSPRAPYPCWLKLRAQSAQLAPPSTWSIVSRVGVIGVAFVSTATHDLASLGHRSFQGQLPIPMYAHISETCVVLVGCAASTTSGPVWHDPACCVPACVPAAALPGTCPENVAV